nr:MAG TPA: ATPase [Crassvirales sp.]
MLNGSTLRMHIILDLLIMVIFIYLIILSIH